MSSLMFDSLLMSSTEKWNAIPNESWHQLRLGMGEKQRCRRRSRLADPSGMSETEEFIEDQEADIVMVSDDE
jgi:hypothetical protein